MTAFLDLGVVLRIAERPIEGEVLVRDYGLLAAALARPQATVFGEEAYPSLTMKAAALLHSLASDHALVDGNKRLAWHATVVFCYLNGVLIDADDDDVAYNLMIAVADGTEADLGNIAAHLDAWSRPVKSE